MIIISETKSLDCAGLVCPMPVAKTKRLLNSMEIGEILEVKGDFGEAGENIKRFVEKQGHEVVDFTINGEDFLIRIKKK